MIEIEAPEDGILEILMASLAKAAERIAAKQPAKILPFKRAA
jgi:hypothetical protein